MQRLRVRLTDIAFFLTTALLAQSGASAQQRGEMLVYFGTYTNDKSKGVYVSRLDLASGKVTPPALAAETPSPSYLAIHPNGNFL
jgi:6-phosphogluconolactonase